MYLYHELTSQIINARISVHKELGCGFLEKVYQEALEVMLIESGIEFEREKQLPIVFHKRVLQCCYVADFVVQGKVIVELKSVKELESIHEAQVINYLKATGLKVGLLINFGQEKIQIKRLAANIY